MFNNILHRGKDLALSLGIKKVINLKIKKFGNISNLSLDTKNKKINLELVLKGEEKALEVIVNNYTFEEKQNKYYLIASDIESSREWLTIILEEYIDKQEFEIPKEYMKMIEAVI
jgi:sporulation protein YlmC with PRC-barrel domain